MAVLGLAELAVVIFFPVFFHLSRIAYIDRIQFIDLFLCGLYDRIVFFSEKFCCLDQIIMVFPCHLLVKSTSHSLLIIRVLRRSGRGDQIFPILLDQALGEELCHPCHSRIGMLFQDFLIPCKIIPVPEKHAGECPGPRSGMASRTWCLS